MNCLLNFLPNEMIDNIAKQLHGSYQKDINSEIKDTIIGISFNEAMWDKDNYYCLIGECRHGCGGCPKYESGYKVVFKHFNYSGLDLDKVYPDEFAEMEEYL